MAAAEKSVTKEAVSASERTDVYALTLDVDWASDDVIDDVAAILVEKRVRATWNVTHASRAVERLAARPDLFELGLHPNFSEGSTQGGAPDAVLRSLRTIAPDAVTLRTHKLIQSTPLLALAAERFGVRYDLSLLLYRTANIAPHALWFESGARLIRLPYFWEDDSEMHVPGPCFDLEDAGFHPPGLKIFNFHPVHVALNASSMTPYHALTKRVPVTKATRNDVRPFIEEGQGAGSLFRALVAFIAARQPNGDAAGFTIREIGERAEAALTAEP